MAKTKRELILVTCFLSGAAAILSLVSLGTQYWVEADGKFVTADIELARVRYGLFTGMYRQEQPVRGTAELQVTCLIDKNVCAFLCGDEDSRNKVLQDIYDGRNATYECITIRSFEFYDQDRIFLTGVRASSSEDYRDFLNAGVWVSTIFFLCLSVAMGLISAGLAVWNTTSNPIEIYFNVFGLYIYNTCALLSALFVCMLWGIMFATSTIHNVAIYQTLIGQISTDARANLGYSYWINLASIVLYASSISLLYWRSYLISREPKVDVHLEDSGDPGIYLY